MRLSQRRARLIARLQVAKTRRREGAVLVEGVRAAAEAIDAGVAVSFAVVSPKVRGTAEGAALADRLRSHDLVEVEDRDVRCLSATAAPQGVMLVCAEPVGDLDSVRRGGRYLVLDGVQDPGNAGTLVRAAVAFAVDGILWLEGTVDPWVPKTVRASAGTIFRISVVRARAADVRGRLGSEEVPIYVADAAGRDVEALGSVESFALVLGNEGGGVRDSLVEDAAERIAVRMAGGADSLNVAMAGSILLHALTGAPGR